MANNKKTSRRNAKEIDDYFCKKTTKEVSPQSNYAMQRGGNVPDKQNIK